MSISSTSRASEDSGAYDIAKWIGVDTTWPPEFVQGLWDEIIPEIETWRQIGVFGPPVVVPMPRFRIAFLGWSDVIPGLWQDKLRPSLALHGLNKSGST